MILEGGLMRNSDRDKTDSLAQLPEEFGLILQVVGKWHDQPFCTSSDKQLLMVLDLASPVSSEVI